MNTQTIFQKELILLDFQRQNYYHRIKYIIFKNSSSKYNEVSHYHLYLISELPVDRNTSLDQQSSSSLCYINTQASSQKLTGLPGLAQRRGIHYLSQQYGSLCIHHQTKLPNVDSTSLPPAEAEDMESYQSQPKTQHSLPITAALLSFKQFFSELISESLTILSSSSKS